MSISVQSQPIIIVGAGMAGLACATWLHRAGRPVLVLEAADAVGGRVRTDLTPEGFRLDRGFQVLQTNYPEARRIFDYRALNLKSFRSGAVIRLPDGTQTSLLNPLKSPLSAFSTLTSPIGSLADKLRIVSLVRHVLQHKPEELLARPNAEDTVTFPARKPAVSLRRPASLPAPILPRPAATRPAATTSSCA